MEDYNTMLKNIQIFWLDMISTRLDAYTPNVFS